MSITEKLKTKRLYFDGGYGTILQSKGLKPGELPEKWNITKPDIIEEIHRGYLSAGCDIIKSNTFGANCLKFEDNELEEIISAAIENGRRAMEGFSDKYLALDIGKKK